jgi:hydrogenase-1 operon protein HyaE
MRSPLIQALVDKYHYVLLTQDNVDDFLQANEDVVLLFTNNPKQFPESNDVAVVLPELMQLFPCRLTPAVVDESAEVALQQRYAFSKWPALVFLRRGDYLGVITGMQNWSDFKIEIERILATTPGEASSLVMPVIAENVNGCS